MRKWLTALLAAAMLLAAAPPVRAAGPDIAAPSAILMDAATGTVLYEKNASERLRPASVTKVMTLLLVMEALDTAASAGTTPSSPRRPPVPRAAARSIWSRARR